MVFAAFKYHCDSFDLKIFPAGKNNQVDWSKSVLSEGHFEFFSLKTVDLSTKAFVEFEKNNGYNIEPIRLKETIRYKCVIDVKDDLKEKRCGLHFKNESNKFLKVESDDERSLTFQFINYLGKTAIFFDDFKFSLSFEVVPDKIKYENDYVSLTNAIAEECSALLLDYSSPTTLIFSQNQDKDHDTVLEQFIFLRQFCYSENLESLFSSIKRNPDRKLVCEHELNSFGTGVISQKFFSAPFSHSQEWNDFGEGVYLPSKIASVRKYDSFDTPANRFIKFALNSFLEICEVIGRNVRADSIYYDEARCVRERIEDILQDSFFDDVMELTIMPSNNQVLEKREGYVQIFNAFLMVDLALKLDWKGKEDVYSGEAKNTALLYEYWLFFELRKILIELSGKECDFSEQGKNRQIITTNDGLTISLQQGKTSRQDFCFENDGISISLYYNKVFSPTEFSNSIYWGSYSRLFRPDYTIAVYPSIYKSEKKAIEAGDVSYIHFDAKYRIQNLTQLFKSESRKNIQTTDNLEDLANITDEENEVLSDEKQDAVVNTYKQGDLLKMHTYNDAIRRTVGSYVLYPGSESKTQKNKNASLYDEILPGVGAFAIRPGSKDVGHEEIKNFIHQIIDFKKNEATRSYRKSYFENMVIASPSEEYSVQPMGSDDIYMVGFFRKDYFEWLKVKHLIPTSETDSEFKAPKDGIYFYYHAIRDGYVYPLHKDIAKTKKFCATHLKSAHDLNLKNWEYLPFVADIVSTELVSKNDLRKRLESMNDGDGYNPQNLSAEFYYLAKIQNIKLKKICGDMVEESDSGNLSISQYSPKVIRINPR